eukprot:Lithocolla_globosa_v1_NODE_915_length_3086_cov_10.832728.p1 type:complete len:893 gc:universal NODE_915_length_3086_cov_10.832728:2856-178(-)
MVRGREQDPFQRHWMSIQNDIFSPSFHLCCHLNEYYLACHSRWKKPKVRRMFDLIMVPLCYSSVVLKLLPTTILILFSQRGVTSIFKSGQNVMLFGLLSVWGAWGVEAAHHSHSQAHKSSSSDSIIVTALLIFVFLLTILLAGSLVVSHSLPNYKSDAENRAKWVQLPVKKFMEWEHSENIFGEFVVEVYESQDIVLLESSRERLTTHLNSTMRKFTSQRRQRGQKWKNKYKSCFELEIFGAEYMSTTQLNLYYAETEIQRLKWLLQTKECEINSLKKHNRDINKEVESLKKLVGEMEHTGRLYHKVSKRHRLNLKKQLLEHAELFVNVAASYGLSMHEFILKAEARDDQKEGDTVILNLQKKKELPNPDLPNPDLPKSLQHLNSDQFDELERLVYILDYHAISNSSYHEIAMLFPNLPRSYWVKDLRKSMDFRLDNEMEVEEIDGNYKGHYQSVSKLIQFMIRRHLHRNPDCNLKKFQLKVSSDGASMSRTTSLEILSISLVQSEDNMSSHGTHTIAVVKGSESYDLLAQAFQKPFEQINKLIADKNIEVDGKKFELEFFLGGDYKFLALVCGIDSASADYCCVWCKIHKKNRFNMDLNLAGLKRVLSEISQMCKKSKPDDRKGCAHPPLLNIPLDHVVMDELHILLRIFDRLMRNLINEINDLDKVLNKSKTKSSPDYNSNRQRLLTAINERLCVSFQIWNKKDASGKELSELEWTALMGPAKKKLLANLPTYFPSFLPEQSATKSQNLWKQFHRLNRVINSNNPTQQEINSFDNLAKNWVRLFLAYGYRLTTTKDVTPYMHVVAYHVSEMLKRFKTIKFCSAEGVEANNFDCNRIYSRQSNRKNPTKDILRNENRRRELEEKDKKRKKRKYEKTNTHFWEVTKKKKLGK